MKLAKEFALLFEGSRRSHGRWSPSTGRMRTEKRGADPEDFAIHLSGEEGIGVVPVRDDGSLVFGVIDIDNHGDDKDIDLQPMAIQIEQLSLPLVPCRSKSGGIHCYLFGTESLNAKRVRVILAEYAKKIGYPSAEIFPKQDYLAGHGEDKQLGNWINLPYFNGQKTDRYAMTGNGKKLKPEEFVTLAKSVAITASALDAATNATHPDAPPCVSSMISDGIGSGDRNKALYNITVYLRKAFPESYFDTAMDMNATIFTAPLPHTEAKRTIRSAARRTYTYKCGEEPCKSRCNKTECVKREYGISRDEFNDMDAASHVPQISDLTRYDTEPVKWSMMVNGREVDNIPTEYLYNFNHLRKMFTEQLNPPIFLPAMTVRKWESIIMPIVPSAKVIDIPKESTPSGIMASRLMDFLSKADSRGNDYDEQKERDRLTRGLPCLQIKDNTKFGVFRMQDFVKYLKSTKSEDMRGAALYFAIKNAFSVKHTRIRIKDKVMTVWMVDLSDRIDPIAPDMTPEF